MSKSGCESPVLYCCVSSLIPCSYVFQNVTVLECIIFQQLTMLRKGPLDGLSHWMH